MKKLSLSLLAALMLLNFGACKKAEEKPADTAAPAAAEAPAPAANDCSAVTVDSLKAKVADPKAITGDEYAAVLEGMACCTINEKSFTIDKKTCVVNDALDALKKDGAKFPSLNTVAARLAKHESPIVRGKAYSSFSSLFGASGKDISIAKDAIKNEKDPYALQELVAGLSNEGNKDPEVGKFLLDMAKHENMFVRRKAANALANTWSDKVDGAVDAVIALFDDSDDNTAKLACAGAGKLGSDKVIEPIVKILNDESKEKMHGDCMRGLSTMWLDYPFHKNHNEAAYKATVDYLKKSPRTNKIPSWSAVATFSTVANNKGEFDNWKKEATWFKMDEFVGLMADLIQDKNFNWLGKGPAMKAVAQFGGKAELEKLGPAVEASGDDKVKDAYKKELESAK